MIHLVYIKDVTVRDIKRIKDGFSIDNVGFLVNESEESIALDTSFMYTQTACRSNQFRIINKFQKAKMEWANKTFFLDKYSNFHGCDLTIGHQEEFEFFVENQSDDFKIYLIFVANLNFKVRTKQFASTGETLKD